MDKIKKHRVTGTSHYLDNIKKLGYETVEYTYSKSELIDAGYENECIYQYNYYPSKIELVPEPDNEYDPNAIKVVADGLLIGYIKKGSCKHLLKVIEKNEIVKIDYSIVGGNYKYISYDEDEDKYSLDKGTKDYYVDLTITEKGDDKEEDKTPVKVSDVATVKPNNDIKDNNNAIKNHNNNSSNFNNTPITYTNPVNNYSDPPKEQPKTDYKKRGTIFITVGAVLSCFGILIPGIPLLCLGIYYKKKFKKS